MRPGRGLAQPRVLGDLAPQPGAQAEDGGGLVLVAAVAERDELLQHRAPGRAEPAHGERVEPHGKPGAPGGLALGRRKQDEHSGFPSHSLAYMRNR